MSAFISSPAPAVTAPGKMLLCGPFWPDLDINHFRSSERIGASNIPDQRIETALIEAVMIADGDLAEWRDSQMAEGFAVLDDVPSRQIGGQHRLALLWRQAVYGHATADLIETHRDITATGTGQSRGDDMQSRADDHRRTAIHAIRAIKGKDRTTVELI